MIDPKLALIARMRAREESRASLPKSAFDLARENGFRGHVDAWLKSLRGPSGDRGDKGERGYVGKQGEIGLRGPPGPTGPIGPMPAHQWDGTKLRFEIDVDEWGKWVDLQGPGGAAGVTQFVAGGIGGGASELFVTTNSYFPSGW